MDRVNVKGKLLIPILVLVLILLSSSCKMSSQVNPAIHNQIVENSITPQYLKDFISAFNEKGISIQYNPKIVKTFPPPDKPYSIIKNEIPDAWVESEIKWYVGKEKENEMSPILFMGFCCSSYNYILESDIDKDYKPSPSNPQSQFPNLKKTILKLYRRKNLNEVFPKKVTNGDYELIKVLDRVGEKGPSPKNVPLADSEQFIVWSASADGMSQNWEIWAYDIVKDKMFLVCSCKDFKDFESLDVPPCSIIPERNLLLLDIKGAGKDGVYKHKFIFYDLLNEGILKEVEDKENEESYLFYRWSSLHAIGDYIYGERFKPHENSTSNFAYMLSDVVRLNLRTWKEEVVISNTPFRIISSSPDGKLGLVPYQKNYLYHDIWIWDIQKSTMTCYMKVELHAPEYGEEVPPPFIRISPKGFFYVNGSSEGNESRNTFYSFKEDRPFYTGSWYSSCFDKEGRFLLWKSPYDMFSPPPPFEYPGKEDRLNGYITLLIVNPK